MWPIKPKESAIVAIDMVETKQKLNEYIKTAAEGIMETKDKFAGENERVFKYIKGLPSNTYITRTEVRNRLKIKEKIIRKFFPEPTEIAGIFKQNGEPALGWSIECVQKILGNPEFLEAYNAACKSQAGTSANEKIRQELQQFTLDRLARRAEVRKRKFVLHIGPTNSGKTFQALQALKRAKQGVYLSPLRLLALEVFDTLNEQGILCSLLTGEECINVPNSGITSSTIELCNYQEHYDVAVIDEAQMLADPDRGARWTNALLQVDADEVHVCLAPEAEDIVFSLLDKMGVTQLELHQYERKTPLLFSGVLSDLSDVHPGDALIAFSRKKVLHLAAALESEGFRVGVLYGTLPPAARREEVRKFTSHQNDIIVATDAIGMGVSLPIQRVVFCETEKYDGEHLRQLYESEIKQIAGRAGRFGIYDIGYVVTMEHPELIQSALSSRTPQIDHVVLPFPADMISDDINLMSMLTEWNRLLPSDACYPEHLEDATTLLHTLRSLGVSADTATTWKFITTPFDIHNRMLREYWKYCCLALLSGSPLPVPQFGDTTLEATELQYKAYDIRHYLQRKFGFPDDSTKKKEQLAYRINNFLLENKSKYLLHCSSCGTPLNVQQIRLGKCDTCLQAERSLQESLESLNVLISAIGSANRNLKSLLQKYADSMASVMMNFDFTEEFCESKAALDCYIETQQGKAFRLGIVTFSKRSLADKIDAIHAGFCRGIQVIGKQKKKHGILQKGKSWKQQ